MRLYTIGYGNQPFSALLERLERALREVGSISFTILDVRRNPQSWCHALSHPAIAKYLQMEGHEYRWCRNLGNNGNAESVQLINERLGLAELKAALESLPAYEELALLCAERKPEGCHRSYIAELARELYGVEVIHL